ncbi:MAG: HlyD family efflux transporter periplasmic adaptor subunit [Desulfobacteraceae bacterium]|nr:HlyD family efflux transporter periplasmic adaptor subunit [Desulfobacteraceae bacterium]
MKGGQERFGSRGKRWVWLLTIVAACALAAAFFLLKPGLPQNKPSPPVSAPLRTDVSCLGRLLPGGRILHVAAPAGAVMKDLLVRRGQWVEQGMILARLRDYAREAALLDRAEKDVAVAVSELECVRAGEKASTIEAQKSAIARQEAILRQEESQFKRHRNLHQEGVVSEKVFEDVQTRRDTARESLLRERHSLGSLQHVRKEDIALAANRVESAESARKVARENVELNLIRAPATGRILEIHAYPGEAVRERGLLEMSSGEEMLVEAEVHVSDIGRVRIGAPAAISGDSISGSLKGEVVEIVSMVTRSDVLPTDPLAFSDVRIVKVWVRLDDPNAVAHLGNHQVSVAIRP